MSIRKLVSAAGLGTFLFGAGIAYAQGQPAADVKVTTTKLGGNFYAIDGMGGRSGALVGPDGIFMVDAQFPQVSDKIVAALKQISDGRIKILINTHVHPDHTGGNENFGKMGAVIMSTPFLRARLLKPAPGANGQAAAPAPPMALPVLTYTRDFTVHMNGEDIQIFPMPPSHTDGDTAVLFPTANVLMTGDIFRSTGFPNIDRANGGTLAGMLQSMNLFIGWTDPATKVVPGHGDITNQAALVAHRDMIIAVRDRVAKAILEKKTVEQTVASKPTADYDAKVGNAAMSADRFVQQLYAEMAPKPDEPAGAAGAGRAGGRAGGAAGRTGGAGGRQ